MKNFALSGLLTLSMVFGVGCTSGGGSSTTATGSTEVAVDQGSSVESSAGELPSTVTVEPAPSDPTSPVAPAPVETNTGTLPGTEPIAAPATVAPVQTNYYRLRVVYTSTANWSTVDPVNYDNVNSVRLMSVGGPLQRYEAHAKRLALISNAGLTLPLTTPLTMVTDVAINKDFATTGLSFIISKGVVGTVVVKVYGYTNGSYSLINQFSHSGMVAGNTGSNPLKITVDAATLQQKAALQTVTHAPIPKKALAFYYPWYTVRDWASPEFIDQPTPLYSTASLTDVQTQVGKAIQSGLTGFVSSWWGIDDKTDVRFKILMEAAKGRPFEYSIYYETLRGGKPVPDAQIVTELSYILKNYGSQAQFIRWDNRPVIFLWATTTISSARWKAIFAQVRANAGDAYFIGMMCNGVDLDVFDGVHEYTVNLEKNLTNFVNNCSKKTKNYAMLSDSHKRKIWVGTAMPGYDDRNILNRTTHVYTPRDNGEYFKTTLTTAINSKPDWIVVTSWNEWGENTHIEASVNYGTTYMELSRQYLQSWLAQ